MDTSTPEGRQKRTEQFVDGYKKTGNTIGIVRLIGGTTEDLTDHINGYDDGEQRGADNFQ